MLPMQTREDWCSSPRETHRECAEMYGPSWNQFFRPRRLPCSENLSTGSPCQFRVNSQSPPELASKLGGWNRRWRRLTTPYFVGRRALRWSSSNSLCSPSSSKRRRKRSVLALDPSGLQTVRIHGRIQTLTQHRNMRNKRLDVLRCIA